MIFEAGGVSDDELDEIRKGILKEIRGQSSGIAGVLKDCFHLGATVVGRENRRRFGPALDLLSCFTFQVELIPF